MKKITTLIVIMVLLPFGLLSQAIQNNAFQVGEELVYEVSYSSALGDFVAGNASVNVYGCDSNPNDFHVIGIGESNRFFDVFYKVRDRFESKIDGATLLTKEFIRNTHEADYTFNDHVYFDRESGIATSTRKVNEVPENVQDIVSAVYFMRTLSLEDFMPDSSYKINFILDDSVYQSIVKYESRGYMETQWGWLPVLKVKPMLATGEVFSKKYPMSVWITDDDNHVPIMAESEIIVGSVKMVLTRFSGLKNPFIKPVKRKDIQ